MGHPRVTRGIMFQYFKYALVISVLILCAFTVVSVAYFALKVRQMQMGELTYEPYAPDGQTRFQRTIGPSSSQEFTGLSEISKDCQKFLILSEDSNFYYHHGVDFQRLWSALQVNLHAGRIVWGGSTLSQQLVKNLFLWRDKSVLRKGLDMIGALTIDAMLTKEQQLAWYVNAIEYGPNLYGIADASKTYFNKSPSELTLLECAALVGTLTEPKVAHDMLTANGIDERYLYRMRHLLRRFVDLIPEEGARLEKQMRVVFMQKPCADC